MGIGLEDLRASDCKRQHRRSERRNEGATLTFTIYDDDHPSAHRTSLNYAIVAYNNVRPVRVRDIGHAVDGPERISSPAGGRQLARGIILSIQKQPSAT